MKIAAAEFMSKDAQKKSIQGLITKQSSRFNVNLDDLRQFSPDLARYVAKNPIEAINMFESQLDRIVQDYTSN
jgi:DNA replicative helicase MCM subunit Mcm2 (Cdc46/Mcm family)